MKSAAQTTKTKKLHTGSVRIVKKSAQAASRIVDGEAVIVLPDEGMVRVLNKVGAFIWEAIDGKKSVAELSCLVTEEFEVSKDKAILDTKEFIGDLMKKKMLKLVGNYGSFRTGGNYGKRKFGKKGR